MLFIRNRIVNFIAKIAGSPDAQNLEPKEPIEIYLDKIAKERGDPIQFFLDTTHSMSEREADVFLKNIDGEHASFVVYVYESEGHLVCDKTYGEIAQAAVENKRIVANLSDATVVPIVKASNSFYATFVSADAKDITVVTIRTDSSVISERYNIATYTENVVGSEVSFEAHANTIYKCGELDMLTITDYPNSGEWCVVFTSGTTPTVTLVPIDILGLESFAAEANTLYEINVLDGRAVVGSWAVSAT